MTRPCQGDQLSRSIGQELPKRLSGHYLNLIGRNTWLFRMKQPEKLIKADAGYIEEIPNFTGQLLYAIFGHGSTGFPAIC
jgi:hypothetical protein